MAAYAPVSSRFVTPYVSPPSASVCPTSEYVPLSVVFDSTRDVIPNFFA